MSLLTLASLRMMLSPLSPCRMSTFVENWPLNGWGLTRVTHTPGWGNRCTAQNTQIHNLIWFECTNKHFVHQGRTNTTPDGMHTVKNAQKHEHIMNDKNRKKMGKSWKAKLATEKSVHLSSHKAANTQPNAFTSDLKTLNGFPGQQSSFTFSSASDANKTSIFSNCRGCDKERLLAAQCR